MPIVDPTVPNEFSLEERKRIRRRVVLAGTFRLLLMVLCMALLAGAGYVLLIKMLVAGHLHALQ
jgi:hypothetical protein